MKNSEKIKIMTSDTWKDKCPEECKKYALKWLELQEEDALWGS